MVDLVERIAMAIYGERDFDDLGRDVKERMFAVSRKVITEIEADRIALAERVRKTCVDKIVREYIDEPASSVEIEYNTAVSDCVSAINNIDLSKIEGGDTDVNENVVSLDFKKK